MVFGRAFTASPILDRRSVPRDLELIRVHLNYVEELLPVYSSMKATHELPPCLYLDERWWVREFSTGSLQNLVPEQEATLLLPNF